MTEGEQSEGLARFFPHGAAQAGKTRARLARSDLVSCALCFQPLEQRIVLGVAKSFMHEISGASAPVT